MKIQYFCFCFLIGIATPLVGNNIQVNNVRLTGQNTTSHFTMVQFDITWENSWRYAGGPANWDAAWVFVKYRIGEAGEWKHAWLNNTGHVTGSNSTLNVGLLSPNLAYNTSTNPGIGVFVYRSQVGSGTFTSPDIQLRWNYGANGVNDNAQVDIRVFAIEHVYIPAGTFDLGSGGTETNHFYTAGGNNPYSVSSENQILVGTTAGSLYYSNTNGSGGDQTGAIIPAFPKGYGAFYMMKYEISQQGYVDFLNTLTRQQQASRVNATITGSQITNYYVLSNQSTSTHRSAVRCQVFVAPEPAPIVFFCDYSQNGVGGEACDGLHLACNYLKSNDVAAYLDWAGLRLITELEYEKSARGVFSAVPNEFPWGNNWYRNTPGIDAPGCPGEYSSDPMSNVKIGFLVGPIRCGAFAAPGRNRTLSGAGYYGCMEMAGNVWERVVTVGLPQGRSYEGTHGDGLLLANGNADVITWPNAATDLGFGLRGGGYSSSTSDLQTSDRYFGFQTSLVANPDHGGRGCRTAP